MQEIYCFDEFLIELALRIVLGDYNGCAMQVDFFAVSWVVVGSVDLGETLIFVVVFLFELVLV